MKKPILIRRLRLCLNAGKEAINLAEESVERSAGYALCAIQKSVGSQALPQSPHKRRGRGKPISEQGRTIAAKKRAKFGKTVKKVHPFVRVKKLHVIILTDTEVG